MGILFSCCMNANDSQTEHPDASIPKNYSCLRYVLHKRNEYEDISSPSTSEPLEDRNSDGNQPNIVLSAPQSYSELHVAVSMDTLLRSLLKLHTTITTHVSRATITTHVSRAAVNEFI